MSKLFVTPFAANGDMIVIPDGEQTDGSVSYDEGFGPDYQKQPGTPGYKFVPRGGHNRLFHDLTEASGEVQRTGFNNWIPEIATVIGGYQKFVIVWHDNDSWQSQVDLNTSEPGTDSTKWLPSAEYMVSYAVAAALAAQSRGWSYVNSNQTIYPGFYVVDTTDFAPVNGLTLTLPASPAHGDTFTFVDPNNNWGNNYWALDLNGKTIEGVAGPLTSKAANTQWSMFYNQTRWEFF